MHILLARVELPTFSLALDETHLLEYLVRNGNIYFLPFCLLSSLLILKMFRLTLQFFSLFTLRLFCLFTLELFCLVTLNLLCLINLYFLHQVFLNIDSNLPLNILSLYLILSRIQLLLFLADH